MGDPREDDADDLETRASGAPGAGGRPELGPDDEETLLSGAPPEAPGGELDLESIPAPRVRRGPPTPTPTPRLPPGASRPPARPGASDDEPDTGEATTPDAPTSEVPRHVATQAGGFAGDATNRAAPEVSEDAEQATVADVRLTEKQKALLAASETPGATVGDSAAGSGGDRPASPVPASKFSRGTARDPIAGTAAHRGTHTGALPLPTHLREGMLLADRYELVRRLGKGGMGEVWQARHTLLQGMRAIKVIKASISRDPAFRARFLSEGQTMMRVKHPRVVEVTDLDETRQNRELFMVMEYVQGRTMHEAVRDEKAPLAADPRTVARVFMELAEGMQRIHDVRIVHKDLKTDNVLLVKGEDGLEHPKVIDFGLAKRLGDESEVPPAEGARSSEGQSQPDLRTTLSGTLAYMAPEQFLGEPSSFRSDVYAFGVMLYECFTRGDYPMPRGSLGEYMDRHRDGVVPKRLRQTCPDLDPFLAELADRCMAPKPEQRPESFTQVARELDTWLQAPERAARRRKMALYGTGVAALMVAAVWGVLQGTKASVGTFRFARADGGDLTSRGNRWYVPADALGDLRFEGAVTGKPGTPSFAVDGRTRPSPLAVEPREGRSVLVGALDLSDLADGEHELAFTVDEGAEPSVARVVVDRRPPDVASVTLSGGGASAVTNADNPELWITLGETREALERVDVTVTSRGRSEVVAANPDEGDPRRWRVAGVHQGDGEQRVEVRATDVAGNVSAARVFSFQRDTVVPQLEVEGLFEGELPVRSPRGNKVRVKATEPVELVASFLAQGATVPTEVRRPRGTDFEVVLPDVPAEGATLTVRGTDAAGNTSPAAPQRTSVRVRVTPDEVTIAGEGGRNPYAPRRGTQGVLRVTRTYPLPPTFQVTLARLLDGDGNRAEAAPEELEGAEVRPVPRRPTEAEVLLPETLRPGTYGVGLRGVDGAAIRPFQLVVDAAEPRVGRVTVTDGEGNVVADGGEGWARTQDVRVAVEVADLSLAKLTLDGVAPEERLQPGARTYTFALRLASEGVHALQLDARDLAESETTSTITVRADWTNPSLQLDAPAAGVPLDDASESLFAGVCSEGGCEVVVTGLPDGERRHRLGKDDRTFSRGWQLPHGAHELSVVAVDAAQRASAPVRVRVNVEQRKVELPSKVTWPHGAASEMRQVAPGAVVLDGRTRQTTRFFLDRTEVTNRQYRAFLAASDAHRGGRAPWDHPEQPAGWSHVPPAETWGDPRWNADDLPVVNVAWWDAYAYAQWSRRRLPTEAEWVKAAAQHDGEPELRAWPPLPSGAPWKDGVIATAETTRQQGPVDATKGDDESPAGCLHMGGNVSEWVDVPWARTGESRTGTRGGSWWTSRFGADVRRVPTKAYDPSFRARTIGFRCAADEAQVREVVEK